MSEIPALSRGRVLFEQERFEQAGAAFLEALSVEPENAEAQALLGLCHLRQKRYKEALEATSAAIASEPDYAFAYFAHAHVQFQTNRVAEAEKTVFKALELQPHNPMFWHLAGACSLHNSNWKQALERADKGLEADPEDADCLNLRAMSLTKMGRLQDARQGLHDTLAEDPENPDTLANLGWAELHASRYKPALEYFQEALRIDPEHEYAREGLLFALRAHYPLYGLMLRFFLFMSNLPQNMQWMVIIGVYLLSRFLSGLARSHEGLAPYILPLRIALFVFVFMTWIATPLINLLLRLNRYGRMALREDDVAQSNLVGTSLVLCGLSAVAALVTGDSTHWMAAGYFLTMVLPLSAIHRSEVGWPRKAMLAVTLAMGALGGLALGLMWGGLTRLGPVLFLLYLVLMLPCQLISIYLMQVQPQK